MGTQTLSKTEFFSNKVEFRNDYILTFDVISLI